MRPNGMAPALAEAVASVTADSVRGLVETVAGFGPRSEEQPEAVLATLEFLTGALKDLGLRPVAERYGVLPHQTNVTALLPGREPELPVIEVGAHWDTVPKSPGADDNASGVAGLLETARCLVAAGPPRRGVRFCFFGEEEPGRRGSNAHVAKLPDEAVLGVIVLEMIGYRTNRPNSQSAPFRVPGVFWPPRTGDFIAVIANRRSASWARAFEKGAARCAEDLKVYAVRRIGGLVKDAARSDHLAYWKSGRRGLMVTDTANLRTPHYHRETDTPDTLDHAFLADVTRATIGAVAHLTG